MRNFYKYVVVDRLGKENIFNDDHDTEIHLDFNVYDGDEKLIKDAIRIVVRGFDGMGKLESEQNFVFFSPASVMALTDKS